LIDIKSATSGVQANFSKTTGCVVGDYLAITDMNAIGAQVFMQATAARIWVTTAAGISHHLLPFLLMLLLWQVHLQQFARMQQSLLPRLPQMAELLQLINGI